MDRDRHESMTYRGFGEVVSCAPPRFGGASSPGQNSARTLVARPLSAITHLHEMVRKIILTFPKLYGLWK